MGGGIRVHVRRCAICGRTVRLPNLATRSHDTGHGFAITDTHALSHLTREERAIWWTLPRGKWHPPTQEREWLIPEEEKENTRGDI